MGVFSGAVSRPAAAARVRLWRRASAAPGGAGGSPSSGRRAAATGSAGEGGVLTPRGAGRRASARSDFAAPVAEALALSVVPFLAPAVEEADHMAGAVDRLEPHVETP